MTATNEPVDPDDLTTTAEAFAAFFDDTSMTAEEFDAALEKGEPVEVTVRLKKGVRIRDERGEAEVNGCAVFLVLAAIIFVIAAGCTVFSVGGTSDCYSTPGAQPGSAQNDRDVQRCLDQ